MSIFKRLRQPESCSPTNTQLWVGLGVLSQGLEVAGAHRKGRVYQQARKSGSLALGTLQRACGGLELLEVF